MQSTDIGGTRATDSILSWMTNKCDNPAENNDI